MAISHEARKKLELILDRHYEGDLLTSGALNDIIAVFDGETNSAPAIESASIDEAVERLKNAHAKALGIETPSNDERRLQIATQLLAGILANSDKRLVEASGGAREELSLSMADRLIELTSGAD